ISLKLTNVWVGGDAVKPTDWNTAANWSDNTVPSTTCADVYIPNTINKPILSGSPVSTITNLHIFPGTIVTINGSGLMQIGGSISNAGLFDVTNGTVELNGTITQNIDGNNFANAVPGQNNTIKNLIISNN